MTAFELKQHAYASGLKSRALSVLVYLIDRANKDLNCFPAIPTMAKQLHISVSTVKRALKELEEAGYIEKSVRWRDNGGQSSNLYQLSASNGKAQPESEKEQPPGAADDIHNKDNEENCPGRPVQPAWAITRVLYRPARKAPARAFPCQSWDGATQLSLWTGVGFNLRPP